jgi:hypothetical protein
LARQGGLDTAWGSQVIDRLAEKAGYFRRLAARWDIRKATLKQIETAIAKNRQRLD